MENIYKIKVRTNPDPRWLYPSERRYSASIVLGLGVVHLALAGTALLLACLTLTDNKTYSNELHPRNTNRNSSGEDVLGMTGIQQGNGNNAEVLNVTEIATVNTTTFKPADGQNGFSNVSYNENNFNFDASLTAAPCVMCLGALAAGLTGLLAWKRWYIDHNIKLFFFSSLTSTLTSSVCLIIVGVLVVITNEHFYAMSNEQFNNSRPSAKYVLTVNVLIASVLEWIWSILSTKVAYVGMRNEYPDDIVISKTRGKVEVSTVHRGNKKGKIVPPDILNHFPVSGKIAKYLPKKPSGNLPKDESNSEYQERVNKFLSSNVDSNSTT